MSCSALPLSRRTRPLAQLPYVLAYNAGRIGSYAAGGVFAGGLGATLAALGGAQSLLVSLRLLAGAMMVAVGLYVGGFARALSWVERLGVPVWRLVAPLARRLVPVRSPISALAVGALWGWLPCGLVYSALAAAAASGSAPAGAATMVAFGVGTLPALVAMGSAVAFVTRAAGRPSVRAAAGVLLIVFGVVQVVHVEGWIGPIWALAHCCAGSHPR